MGLLNDTTPWTGKSGRPIVLLVRALGLRCPRCGRRRIVRRWFTTPDPCATCGLDFNPDGDAAVGWIIVNLGVTMILLFAIGLGGMVLTWPNVPWTGLTVATILVSGSVPFLLVPFSRTVWAAIFLLLHRMDGPAEGQDGA
jgi:uncharacterized protein (DUF983 family)